MAIKIKLRNGSGIDGVRFRGVHFDPNVQFSVDLADGELKPVANVPNGSIGLTAYRIADQQALDSLQYPISDEYGFAAVLLFDESDPYRPYRLVGEPFVIG